MKSAFREDRYWMNSGEVMSWFQVIYAILGLFTPTLQTPEGFRVQASRVKS